jgi:hypothetical protein
VTAILDSGSIYEVSLPEAACAKAHRLSIGYLKGLPRPPRRRVTGTVLALGTTLLVHTLLISSAIWGARALHARQPDQRGAGASAIVSSAEPVMTLILINEPRIRNDEPAPDTSLASLGAASAELPILVLSPDAFPAVDWNADDQNKVSESDPVSTADNTAMRAVLFGRYMGQISARVTRAWIRPRTPIGAPLFKCAVQIHQDPHGMVREITLQRCNGDSRWQQSLIQAIESASPLSGPPDTSVFTETVSLTFQSSGFSMGIDPQGFEAEAQLPVEQTGILWQPRDGGQAHVIDLRIVGHGAAAPAPGSPADIQALPMVPLPDLPPFDSTESEPPP